MKHLLLVSLILLSSCHSTTSKKGQEFETDSIPQQEELCPDSISETEPVSLEEKQEKSSKAIPILQPVPRDIPTGEAISSDSLSMKTEYDYYPLSTTKVKVIITNHSHYEYSCGEGYSLAYYNEKQKVWEILPTSPIVNSILWIFPLGYSTHEQTIELYTAEAPNRAGRYRIYKSFNGDTKVAYAEFELVDKKGVEKLRQQIDDYWGKNAKISNDTTARNIHSTWIQNDDGDTIFVGLMNNTPHYQEMFRKRVVSYSAVSHGKIQQGIPFIQPTSSDTMRITMQTEHSVYPVGTETISVELANGNSKDLFFGERYNVARKEGNRWILLHDGGAWNDIGYGLGQGDAHLFTARLRPIVNDNKPGTYKVVKEIGFKGSSQKWYMGAEFRIE
ncbi:immunoglobulin-like domain-containing protein [Phocaeicola faecalis]